MAMTTKISAWRLCAALTVTAAALAACNDDTTTVPPRTVNSSIDFSTFATQAFANSANSPPVPINGVNFSYDVNDEPNAFASLIESGSYQ
jgi:hypothetical protein